MGRAIECIAPLRPIELSREPQVVPPWGSWTGHFSGVGHPVRPLREGTQPGRRVPPADEPLVPSGFWTNTTCTKLCDLHCEALPRSASGQRCTGMSRSNVTLAEHPSDMVRLASGTHLGRVPTFQARRLLNSRDSASERPRTRSEGQTRPMDVPSGLT